MGLGQAGEGAAALEPPLLQHGHAVTRHLGLVHLVGGEDDGLASNPHNMPGVHLEPPVWGANAGVGGVKSLTGF